MIYISRFDSPLGDITLAAKEGAIVGLWIEGQKYFLGKNKDVAIESDSNEPLAQAKDWLRRYFGGKNPAIDELLLAPAGSEFAKSVWDMLCKIPYGQTTTYGEIARQIAAENGFARMSAQAIGGAVGHNPISIIVPCHRVVGANGSLTGYAGGIDKKIWLLRHEGLDVEKFRVPTNRRFKRQHKELQ